MPQIFLSWLRKAKFLCLILFSIFKNWRKSFSFSSRFSRFWRPISLSLLDFQYFGEHFSVYTWFSKIFFLNFLIIDHLSMIYQNMRVSLYHLTTFCFTQRPDWFLTFSWHCVKDGRKGFLRIHSEFCTGGELSERGWGLFLCLCKRKGREEEWDGRSRSPTGE